MTKTLTVEKKETSNVDKFRDNIEKSFGKESGIFVDDPENIVIEKFPTGSLYLDIYLKGGHAKGKMAEFYGKQGSGKTTTAIEAAKQHQIKYPNELILWEDLEDVFDPNYFKGIGVDISPEKFMLVRPDTGEQGYEIMLNFVKNNHGGLIIVDSVTGLLPEKLDAADMGDATMSLEARLNSQGIRKLAPHSKRSKTTIIFLNQVRDNIGNTYFPNKTTGGNTIPFYARTRLELSRYNLQEPTGRKETHMGVTIKTEKANFGIEKAKFSTEIEYGKGFDCLLELINLGEEAGIIKKSGSWYAYDGNKIGQGVNQVKELLVDNDGFKEELEKKVRSYFGI